MSSAAYLECRLVCRRFRLLDTQHGLAEELLRACLLVEHLVGRNGGDDARQSCRVGLV